MICLALARLFQHPVASLTNLSPIQPRLGACPLSIYLCNRPMVLTNTVPILQPSAFYENLKGCHLPLGHTLWWTLQFPWLEPPAWRQTKDLCFSNVAIGTFPSILCLDARTITCTGPTNTWHFCRQLKKRKKKMPKNPSRISLLCFNFFVENLLFPNFKKPIFNSSAWWNKVTFCQTVWHLTKQLLVGIRVPWREVRRESHLFATRLVRKQRLHLVAKTRRLKKNYECITSLSRVPACSKASVPSVSTCFAPLGSFDLHFFCQLS